MRVYLLFENNKEQKERKTCLSMFKYVRQLSKNSEFEVVIA